MSNFNHLKSAQSLRSAPKNGSNRSENINDSFAEILHDLAELFNFTNNTIIPVLNGLGAPGTYTDINAVTQGLDGKTMLTDNDWVDVGNTFFYSTAQGRPKTVKETALKFSQDINALYSAINTINARIGAIDTDENTNPATLSEIENSLNYFINLVNTINTNTTGYLTASGIATGIADGSINPSSFNIIPADITLNAGLRPTDISGIDVTAAFDYTTGEPATYDIQDSIWRVKEFAEDVSGDSIVTFAGSGLSGDSLKTHREKVGTGTVTTSNPHGLDVGDLSDTNSVTLRTTEVASFNVKISGLSSPDNYADGYAFVPENFTVTRIAGTVVDGGSTGLTLGVYRRRSSVNEFIHSGLSIPASTPGSVSQFGSFLKEGAAASDGTDLIVGDLIFVSGLSGDGLDARVFVWGTPV